MSLLPVDQINSGTGQSLTDWYVYQLSQGVQNPSFYGASADAPQKALDTAALQEAQALFSSSASYPQTAGYLNGVYVGIGNLSGGGSGVVSGGGYYDATTGAITPGIMSGSSISGGPLVGGTTIPGGTAGTLGSTGGPATSVLSSLSHTTAGLNWSHLALWLAILAGAYIVLETLTSGKGRRR